MLTEGAGRGVSSRRTTEETMMYALVKSFTIGILVASMIAAGTGAASAEETRVKPLRGIDNLDESYEALAVIGGIGAAAVIGLVTWAVVANLPDDEEEAAATEEGVEPAPAEIRYGPDCSERDPGAVACW